LLSAYLIERAPDILSVSWADQPGYLLTVAHEDQRRPQLDVMKSTQSSAFAIFDFEMLNGRAISKSAGNQRLSSLAMATPVCAKFKNQRP